MSHALTIVTSAEAARAERRRAERPRRRPLSAPRDRLEFARTLRTFRSEDIAAHQVIVAPVLM